ncbi:hypothetical protein N9H57_04370 [Flavobacteriaceae bacterium]|nr:hypothetical protein [Flavobacteriaceae bacterium]MDB3862277.1 hypothetical protein [Flavobacteriaceae bacterium]
MRFIILGIFLFTLFGCSPNSETDWTFLPPTNGRWDAIKTYGGSQEDIAHGIQITKDGGFVVVGNTQSTDGNFSNKSYVGSDIFLMKFSATYDLEWTQTFGGSGDDRGHDVVQLSDGGFAVVGYSKSSDGDLTQNQGQHDNWVFKVDAHGDLLWQKSFGFFGHDHAYNIIATSDGGLFFNGFLDVTASNGQGQDGKQSHLTRKHGVGEFWCHKLDENGNLQWRRYFGGTSNDRSYDAVETQKGNFILVGSSESQDVDVSNPKGGYDIWVVKIDSKGNLLWERSVGGSEYDIGKAVIETQTGNFLIAGQTFSQDKDISNPLGSSDGILAWLSSEGELIVSQNIGASEFDTLNDLIQRPDGTLMALGYSGTIQTQENVLDNDVTLYYTRSNGALMSSHRIEGNGLDLGEAIALNPKGDVIIVGSTDSSSGQFSASKGGKDILIAIWN